MTLEATTESSYKVKSGSFEGPLPILLDLIEKRKLFVNEVSLAEVTADYITYVRSLPKMNLIDTTSFVLVAATLILIKSRSLLPNLELSKDEEDKIVDLESRLNLYALMRDASTHIEELFGIHVRFMAPERQNTEVIFTPHPSISKNTLREALERVINQIPKQEVLQEIEVRKVISIDEMIEDLSTRIQKTLSMSFTDFSKHPAPADEKEKKVYVIVSFLAMLELVRGGIVDVLQEHTFSDMTITHLSTEEK